MIDLHHHCLPGIDDGPESWDEAVRQCRMAFDEGVHTIVATPHVHRDPWINSDPAVIRQLVGELNERIGGSPRILPGCEYYYGQEVIDQLSDDGSIICLADSRYFLTEFPATLLPAGLERSFFEVVLAGHIPIIAHPERNRRVQNDPDVLIELIRRGARVQITAGSVVGRFGERSEASAYDLLDREMVHFVSTDTHDCERRPPMARAAIGALIERYGEERTNNLTELNPLAVIENRELVYDPEPRDQATTGLWSVIKSWIVQ